MLYSKLTTNHNNNKQNNHKIGWWCWVLSQNQNILVTVCKQACKLPLPSCVMPFSCTTCAWCNTVHYSTLFGFLQKHYNGTHLSRQNSHPPASTHSLVSLAWTLVSVGSSWRSRWARPVWPPLRWRAPKSGRGALRLRCLRPRQQHQQTRLGPPDWPEGHQQWDHRHAQSAIPWPGLRTYWTKEGQIDVTLVPKLDIT